MSRSRTGSYILAGCLALSASFPSFSQQAPREAGEPEAATGYVEKQALASKDYMVVAANPYASWAERDSDRDSESDTDRERWRQRQRQRQRQSCCFCFRSHTCETTTLLHLQVITFEERFE